MSDLKLHPGQEQNSDQKALKSLFKITLQTRNFEIQQLVQRNNFFMIFQGVLFAGVIQSSHNKPVVSFLVCLAGLTVSLFQIMMASGAKFWQEYWEEALQKVEDRLLQSISSVGERQILLQLFHDDQCKYETMVKNRLSKSGTSFTTKLVMARFSVSRVPIYVAIGLSCIWFLLMLCTMRGYPPLSIPSFIVGF